MIVSYYNGNSKENKFNLKRKKFVKTYKSQRINDEFVKYWDFIERDKKHILALICCCILITLLVSITAVIIGFYAYYGDPDYIHCNDIVLYHLIDPILFIIVGGTISILHIILNVITRFITWHIIKQHMNINISINNAETIITITKNRHRWLYLNYIIPTWIMLLFYCVWSMIGFIAYHYEMTYECKHSSIGQMMISWSVIIFIETICYYATYIIKGKLQIYEREIIFIIFYPSTVLSIVLLIIIHNDEFCNDQIYPIMHPTDLVSIGGILSCIHISWIIVCTVTERLPESDDMFCIICMICQVFNEYFSFIMSIGFYFIWSVLGFYTLSKMSIQCIKSQYGTTMLIWCGFMVCGALLWWAQKYKKERSYEQCAVDRIFCEPCVSNNCCDNVH